LRMTSLRILVALLLVTCSAHFPQAANNYFGVRYADQPPRWQPTNPASFDPYALSIRPSSQNFIRGGCLQFDSTNVPPSLDASLEDCFFLNLWLPDNRTVANKSCNPAAGECNLPVLFWIYGGGFQNGHAKFSIAAAGVTITENLFDGTDFANQGRRIDGRRSADLRACLTLSGSGMIVVTFDFRMGAMGYFRPPSYMPGADVSDNCPCTRVQLPHAASSLFSTF